MHPEPFRTLAFQNVSLEPRQILQFRKQILTWYGRSKRKLPWRSSRDPYCIWVSEIMLQQTRVTAVVPYYQRFLSRFPDFYRLAESLESDLLAHWAGLGYYYRARNMQRAAREMARQGTFPKSYDAIRALPGIGDYTAAAVASISFNLPHAVVDGNVFRVLSRVANDPTDIASSLGKKRFTALAETLLDREQPGEYNQAVMELGATVCLPKNPQCLICPVQDLCLARASGRQNELPVKTKNQKTAEESRTLYWIERDEFLLLWQRPPDSSLMPGFWELPEPEHLPAVGPGETIGAFRHAITFHGYLFTIKTAKPPDDLGTCQWIPKNQALNPGKMTPSFPVSTVFRKAAKVIASRVLARMAAI
jgi:A/G-specific adenine glycosylase